MLVVPSLLPVSEVLRASEQKQKLTRACARACPPRALPSSSGFAIWHPAALSTPIAPVVLPALPRQQRAGTDARTAFRTSRDGHHPIYLPPRANCRGGRPGASDDGTPLNPSPIGCVQRRKAVAPEQPRILITPPGKSPGRSAGCLRRRYPTSPTSWVSSPTSWVYTKTLRQVSLFSGGTESFGSRATYCHKLAPLQIAGEVF